MKNANGYGSVYKLSGNRRRPWIVRKTAGWEYNEATGKYKQLYTTIGTYAKRDEAIRALADYNESPYSLEKLTFSELYDKWFGRKFHNPTKQDESSIKAYEWAFRLSEPLHDLVFAEIKTIHMQDCIDKSGKNYPTRKKIKILYNQLYGFAMENDLVTKDYSKFVKIGKKEKTNIKQPFSNDEIKKLFEAAGKIELVEEILILIYMGWRPQEFLDLRIENVDLQSKTIQGGLKTEAGIDRVVPIPPKIFSFVVRLYNSENEYLFLNKNGKPMSYDTFLDKFKRAMAALGMKHLPQECRHTYASMLDRVTTDKKTIQLLMGHESYVTTANTYVHKDLETLRGVTDLFV